MKKITITVLMVSLMSIHSLMAADKQTIVLGIGQSLATYNQLGQTLCQTINQETSMHGISCKTQTVQAATDPIHSLKSGNLDVALVRSDWHSYAYEGSHLFADAGPFKDLRTLVSFHPHSFTVLANADIAVDTFYDLRGKRVNLGPEGSESRAVMVSLMEGYRWSEETFASVSELEQQAQTQALCDGTIDAAIYVVHHPSPIIKAAMDICALKLVRVDGNPVRRLIGNNPNYRWVSIPANMYANHDHATRTLAVAVKLVGSNDLAESTAYALTEAIFKDKMDMVQFSPVVPMDDGPSAESVPFHEGALKYHQDMKM